MAAWAASRTGLSGWSRNVARRDSFEKIGGYMQNPKLGEDYVVVSGKHLYATQRSAVVNRLRDLGVLNLDDANNHVIKPGMVNLIPNVNTNGGRVDMSRRNIRIR